MLVAATRGRWLPRAGAAAAGRMHGQGFVFAGRHPGGRWRALGDPPDTRLVAMREHRVPAAVRLVGRREAALARARGVARLLAWARLAAARRALRRAEQAAEDHASALAEHDGGYRGASRRPDTR